MKFLQVTNWTSLQQYKDRDPKWIKVYRELLDDYRYSRLSDTQKSHVIGLWLLAAKLDNKIPFDAEWIKLRIGSSELPDLTALTEAGFIELYNGSENCVQPKK